jgi:hypothetical protein
LLLKRESSGLVLANASQVLYTPQQQHQLYAKGIVYRRAPYRLVSLPLIKIYNVGERDVTVADLAALAEEADVRLRFLRKMDGSLVQVFRADGRVWFSTRGMIEGARPVAARHLPGVIEQDEEGTADDFDYLANARQMAQERYPRLIEDPEVLQGRTLLFELIHPQARKVTNYGERADLVFLACFDHARCIYHGSEELRRMGERWGLTVVDALSPAGGGLVEQIESLLADLAGTDEEGSVVNFERHGEVIYRVKVKSPEYLQLMRLMAFCTYERTVEFIDSHPNIRTWDELRQALQEQGSERVPEEVLVFYRQHYDRFQAYLSDLERLKRWAIEQARQIDESIGGRSTQEPGAYRKAFAARAVKSPHSGLIFASRDDRLDTPRLRKSIRSDAEARQALRSLGLE